MTVPLPIDSRYDNIISTESKKRRSDEESNTNQNSARDSNMYVDSDEENHYDNPPSMLIANMSPLRNRHHDKRDKHE